MSMSIRDAAKKIAASQATGGGNYIKNGKGVMVVKSLLYKTDLEAGTGFIAELLVDSVEPYIGADGKPEACNPVGSTVSFVQLFDKYRDTALGNTKAFIEALYGQAFEGDAFLDKFEKICSEANPARGIKIGFSTYEKMTRTTKKLLILPRWEHIEQTVDEVKATRERLKL